MFVYLQKNGKSHLSGPFVDWSFSSLPQAPASLIFSIAGCIDYIKIIS
jgi:hypothetical protein